ncbi:monodechloroaminopyrrolnitrin synthase PrnB family protein [Nakamurella endophytica]|uniref:Uncharacterized protein n=1 Tax=Nakamurella endophytica TaxID=1748367 RepID=A0A917WC58_9ACTN|nr:monodechloroaminopyrrolnitrin synthase PrnB family protein [Nakamurella endophytica]GGL91758.1 hypothetical protein GCM10011594_09430 [Nakamurella endophytica]
MTTDTAALTDETLAAVTAAAHGDASADGLLDTLLLRGCTGSGAPADPLVLDHAAVRDADPLGLDAVLRRLPLLNDAGDTGSLTAVLAAAVERGGSVTGPEPAAAALRDTGMVMASLRRHGVDPVAAVPGLAALLTRWAAASGTIPRDTVVHYGWWNPTGPRERHYTTATAQESLLIDSVRQSCRTLPAASIGLDRAWHAGLTTPVALLALGAAVQALQSYGAMFETVRTGVSPVWFAQQLRPYFDPITVDGVAYCGPAAAFVPLYLVDELLWGTGADHTALHREAVEYGRTLWRDRRGELADHPPLDEVVAERLHREGETAELAEAARLFSLATRALVRFRGQHATLARGAYRTDVTGYSTGSGGWAPATLLSITTENRDAATHLDDERRCAGHHRQQRP